MGKSVNVFQRADGKFTIERQNADGKVATQIEDAYKVSDLADAIRFAVQSGKGQQTATNHWQSLVCEVLRHPMMDGMKGAGDRTTGKTSDVFRDLVRKAEDAVFDQAAADKVRGVPTDVSERTDLVRKIRNDKNYSNIKSTCAKYFAFVGALPMTDSGYLVPRAVMLAQIASVLEVTPTDNSLVGRINALKADIEALDKPDAARAVQAALAALVSLADARYSYACEVATNAAANLPPNAGDAPHALREIAQQSKVPAVAET